MRNLRELLTQNSFLSEEKRPKVFDEKTVLFIAKKVLQEEYGVRGSENILPTLYREKKLFLTPRSSLWANEVWIQRKSLTERINEALGDRAVVEIKLTQGN